MQYNFKPHHYKFIVSDISEGLGEAFEIFVPAFHAYIMGETIKETVDAYHFYFKDEQKRRKREGIPMPTPDIDQKKKQVPLRLTVSLFERISSKAKSQGLSFNQMVVNALENI